jgi:hypothetical protein
MDQINLIVDPLLQHFLVEDFQAADKMEVLDTVLHPAELLEEEEAVELQVIILPMFAREPVEMVHVLVTAAPAMVAELVEEILLPLEVEVFQEEV